MQDKIRRSNKERSNSMRTALLHAARDLFVRHGYAATGTPEIVAAAGVTRGALYHHFADKEALFRAVVEAEAEQIASDIRAVDFAGLPPVDALIRGGDAFLAAMRVPGRTRLLLLDGPAVLGRDAMNEIDARTGGMTLVEGLGAALPGNAPVSEIAQLLSAAFDRAALAISSGGNEVRIHQALAVLIRGLAA